MGYVVAVDSGGTFSDCVVIDDQGQVITAKAPSTPADYSEGVLAAVAEAAARLGRTLPQLLAESVLFAHGTTVATNTLLTRTGAKVGLMTTLGHEDVLLIGRTYQKVAGLPEEVVMDIAHLDKPEPLVPRWLTVGVPERLDWQGREVVPLDRQAVLAGLERLLAEGIEALAVSLLWSFRNPSHEQAIREIVQERVPELSITCSSDLVPVMKEYERTATTVLNAYLGARTARYLAALEDRLATQGLAGPAVVMQSNGGVVRIERARERAVQLLTSGPAGGLVGARYLARLLGHPNVVTTDVGGTSFDVGLLVDGEPLLADAPVFDQYQLILPVIDVATIGTGGGSIARVEHGVLKVGPESAGADPGPACYGKGGKEPTVTDANVVLGRLNPERFLGGRMRLDREAAERAIRDRLARPLGLSLEEAALGVVAIADAHMADLVRRVTVERGFDPREFVLYAFGGAGPLHAGAYAEDAGCRKWLVPLLAPVFSAFGIAQSDLTAVAEASEPMYAPLPAPAVRRILAELEGRVRQELLQNGAREADIRFERFVTMRYRGQIHEIRTPILAADLQAEQLDDVTARFERLYEQRYGRGTAYRRAGIQAFTFRVMGRASLFPPAFRAAPVLPHEAEPYTERAVILPGRGKTELPIYRAEALKPGARLSGPAVVEAEDTTIFLPEGHRAEVDGYQNLVVEILGGRGG